MFRKYLFVIMLFFVMNNICGQSKMIDSRHSISVGLLGVSGTPLSVHYDRILHKAENGYFNLNLGFGYTPLNSFYSPIIGIPLTLNYTQGLKNHHLEIGTGLCYNSGMRQYEELDTSDNDNVLVLDQQKSKVLFLSSRIGYKYQRSEGGMFFRVGFTPLITLFNFSSFKLDDKIVPLFEMGIGYAF